MKSETPRKEKLGSSAARSLTLLYIGQGFNILITVATFVVLTRLLGPSSYGLYVFAFSFSGLLSASGNFGISSFFGKNLSKYSQENDGKGIARTIASGYAVLIPVAIILTLLGVGLSGVVADLLFANVGISMLSLALASVTIFFLMIQNSTVGGLIGFFRVKEAAITTIVIDLVQLVSIVTLLTLGYGLNGAIIGMLLGYVVGTLLALYFMIRSSSYYKGFRLEMPTWLSFKETFAFAWPLGANNILNLATQNFSVLLLGLYVSTVVLGNYGVALKGISLMAVLYSTMSNVLVPTFSAAGTRKPQNLNAAYNKIMVYSLIITLPVIVYVGVMARPEIFLFFSHAYTAAPLYLALISLGTAISMIGYFLGSLITARGVTMKFLKYNTVATLVELVALIALTPYYTVVGSIVAIFIIGNIATNALLIKLARDVLKAELNYRKMVAVTVVNLLLVVPIAAALLLTGSVLELVVGAIILVLVYPILLGALRLVDRKELNEITSFTSRIRGLSTLTAWFCAYTQLFMPRGAANG